MTKFIIYDTNAIRHGPIYKNNINFGHVILDLVLTEMGKGNQTERMLKKNFKSWKEHISNIYPGRSVYELYEFEKTRRLPVYENYVIRLDVLDNFRKMIYNASINTDIEPYLVTGIRDSALNHFDDDSAIYLKNDYDTYKSVMDRMGITKLFKKADNQESAIIDLAVKGADLFLEHYYKGKCWNKNRLKIFLSVPNFQFVSWCSFVIRALLWIRDGGFESLPDKKVVNDTADIDWCSIAVLFRHVVTNEDRNIVHLNILNKCLERKMGKVKIIRIYKNDIIAQQGDAPEPATNAYLASPTSNPPAR